VTSQKTYVSKCLSTSGVWDFVRVDFIPGDFLPREINVSRISWRQSLPLSFVIGSFFVHQVRFCRGQTGVNDPVLNMAEVPSVVVVGEPPYIRRSPPRRPRRSRQRSRQATIDKRNCNRYGRTPTTLDDWRLPLISAWIHAGTMQGHVGTFL